MDEQADDLVLSYTVMVGEGGVMIGGNPEVRAALQRGYRVVDVIPTACAAGEFSFVCVTVVLTRKSSMNVPYRGYSRQVPPG